MTSMTWIFILLTVGKANLPLQASIGEVEILLDIAIKSAVSLEGSTKRKGGQWRYQLVTRDLKRVVNKSSLHLRSSEDYKKLVDSVRGEGEDNRIAMLTQVSTSSQTFAAL